MILTKEEFQREFEYNSLPAVHRLIREKKIEDRSDGMIDTETEKNKEWCLKRWEKIKKRATKGTKTQEEKPTGKKQKPEAQLNLELDILNEKYEQAQKQNRLLDLKITKEQGDTISTGVLNRCIISTFDEMFKSLADIPNIYASDVVDIVQSSDSPKEAVAEYLTSKIVSALKMGLDCAKKTTKKYYESEVE